MKRWSVVGLVLVVLGLSAFASGASSSSSSPNAALGAARSQAVTCPAQDTAGFPLGPSSNTGDPLFCSYPAVSGEDPNDFFCTYNVTTGALVTDHDAGFCPATAPGGSGKATTTLATVAGGTVVIGSGSKLTDTATLSGGSSPTGTITFTLKDPSNATVYTDVVTVSGNGSYDTTAGNNPGGYLPTVPGTHVWSATYSGDSSNAGSSDNGANESETVTGIATTTTITSDSPDPSSQGVAVTVHYTVTSGSGTPTGNVTVSDGVDNCTDTVAAGQCSITLTTVGSRTLIATYAASGSFAGGTSAGEPHTVLGSGDQLAALKAAATDASPKSKLGKKVGKIENYVAANNILGACAGLADFIQTVNAQAGKKGLSKGEAAALVSEAEDIESTLGC